MSTTVDTTAATAVPKERTPLRPARILLHVFLGGAALAWLAPLLWALYAAMRPYGETSEKGYVSWPDKLSLDNFTNAFTQSDMTHYFVNTLIIAVPAVLLTLFLSSMVAFYVSRFDFRVNIFLLLVFTAGNLLPQQVIITPLYRLYLLIDIPGITMSGKLYDSALGLVLIHVAFQSGFCAFVLSNYMRSLPHELTEAALVDGASVWRLYWQIVLPLCRPAMAALATLLSIWIYNDFFWALVLISTGENMPITSALNNLSGQYFTDPNLVAAGCPPHRDPHTGRVLRAPAAVRQWSDPGRQQGLTARPAAHSVKEKLSCTTPSPTWSPCPWTPVRHGSTRRAGSPGAPAAPTPSTRPRTVRPTTTGRRSAIARVSPPPCGTFQERACWPSTRATAHRSASGPPPTPYVRSRPSVWWYGTGSPR